mgnify:CR=1 FL=1
MGSFAYTVGRGEAAPLSMPTLPETKAVVTAGELRGRGLNVIAATLEGIVSQQLLAKAGTKGRSVACEILVTTPAARNLIREGKTHQLYTVMQTGTQYGMQTMNSSLADLVRKGHITKDLAIRRSSQPEDLERLLLMGAA